MTTHVTVTLLEADIEPLIRQKGTDRMTNLYATDGRCHNAEPGTYGHECGKPAVWVGTSPGGFRSGFCQRCRDTGYEARSFTDWTPID